MGIGGVVQRGNPAIAGLRNATHRNWWQDAGLRKLTLAITVGFAGTVNSGYDGSLFNGLQSMPIFMNNLKNPNGNDLGLISAAYALGGIPGYLPASYITDRWGRRLGIFIGACLIILGSFIQTFTNGPWSMFGGRFVVGFGGSFQSVSVGPYVAEISHPRNRAQTTALINTCWYIGSIIAAWTTFGTVRIDNHWCWKVPCLLQILPCVYQLALLAFIPESPRYLIAKGREDEAYTMLKNAHANGVDGDELVDFEFAEIKEAIAFEQSMTTGVSYSSFLKTKGNRHRLVILILVGFYSQWVGNGIASYYLSKILTSVGMTDPNQQTGLNGGLQVYNWLAAIAGSMLCERLGRRFLWLTSATGMLLAFSSLTACSAVYAHTENPAAGRAVIAMLFVFYGAYDIAFTGLTVSYPLEILPFSLRSKGVAITQLVVACALFFNQYVNPIALDALAWKYYFVYIVMLVTAVINIYFLYPETRGRTLEEIATIFDGEAAEVHGHAALAAEHHSHTTGKVDSKEGLEADQRLEYQA